MKNSSTDRIIQCFLFAGFSLILFFIGLVVIPCFDGGCALMFISIFLFFSSLAVAGIIFYPMSRAFDAVVNDSDLLAHWTYDPSWYARIIESEYEEHTKRNTALLIMIDGMLLICALFFIVFVPDGGIETGIVLLLIAGLMVLISKFTPGFFRNRKAKMPAEAWISTRGLIYEGTVYPYSGFLYSFTGVSYRDEKEPTLVFRFYQITGAKIYEPFEITVPVPKGEEEKAKAIPAKLNF
ncbi:MAG TPA: hypothetical protein PK024_00765 [Methanospirillum sp.]|uniref:hypothetical protein n=1 Tax=Methanospirillum sp. TaxID=45200 RepID=UPI002CA05E83|nr:hypothetical protein [Methanospirillum sp.]HOJ95361.1 hypothetical protein [Methanospirillum sp.]HPP76842.1 hypothetical protein [Methanospirillum sp.]